VPTTEEIEAIIVLWDQGKSFGEIANHLNGKKSTVQGWIEGLIKRGRIKPRTNGIRTNTKNATNAKRTYDLKRRLELNDVFFEQLETLVKGNPTARDFKDLMISYGILEDKRQLLEPIKPDGANGKAAIVAYVESERLKHEASRTES
jgi:predicted transcriptional regulator